MSDNPARLRSRGIFIALTLAVAATVTLVLLRSGADPAAPSTSRHPGGTVAGSTSSSESEPDIGAGLLPDTDRREPLETARRPLARRVVPSSWPSVTGSTRRQDSGWPVKCSFTAFDEDGNAQDQAVSTVLGGTFHVRVPPLTTHLVITPRNALDLDSVTLTLPSGAGLEARDILLPLAHGLIHGQIVDKTGAGVEGITVHLNGRTARRTSGRTGSFLFAPLRDGSYALSIPSLPLAIGAPTGRTVTVKKGVQQEILLFTVERGSTILGTVRDSTGGKPLARVQILLERPDAHGHYRVTNTDQEGRYQLMRLVGGNFQLTASTADNSHGRVVLQIAGLGTDEERIVPIRMAAGAGTLTGHLRDDDGTPVPFATMAAHRVKQQIDEPLAQVLSRTDTRGLFTFRSLPAGRWEVAPAPEYCESHNWIPTGKVAVDLVAGKKSVVELRVHAGALVTGRVVSTSHRQGLWIRMRHDNGSVTEEAAGDEGKFAFGGLEPGLYLLEVLDGNDRQGPPLAQQTVLVSPRKRASVELHTP